MTIRSTASLESNRFRHGFIHTWSNALIFYRMGSLFAMTYCPIVASATQYIDLLITQEIILFGPDRLDRNVTITMSWAYRTEIGDIVILTLRSSLSGNIINLMRDENINILCSGCPKLTICHSKEKNHPLKDQTLLHVWMKPCLDLLDSSEPFNLITNL